MVLKSHTYLTFIKTVSNSWNFELNFYSFSKLKLVNLRSFWSSLPFSKFFNQNFIHFWRKHVETWNQSNFLLSQVSHALNAKKSKNENKYWKWFMFKVHGKENLFCVVHQMKFDVWARVSSSTFTFFISLLKFFVKTPCLLLAF